MTGGRPPSVTEEAPPSLLKETIAENPLSPNHLPAETSGRLSVRHGLSLLGTPEQKPSNHSAQCEQSGFYSGIEELLESNLTAIGASQVAQQIVGTHPCPTFVTSHTHHPRYSPEDAPRWTARAPSPKGAEEKLEPEPFSDTSSPARRISRQISFLENTWAGRGRRF